MTAWRDQVALVTGGARGIGQATARLLAQRRHLPHAQAAVLGLGRLPEQDSPQTIRFVCEES